MVITRNDAAQALADIQRTESRGKDARMYRGLSSILILWGGVWFVAYTATGLLPPQDWWTPWIPGNLIGFAGTALLSRNRETGKSGPAAWMITLATIAFITALNVTNPPHSVHQAELIPALMVAFLYILIGALRLARYAWIGSFLFVASLVGFFALPQFFSYWLAIVGGGTLVVSGLWLRSA